MGSFCVEILMKRYQMPTGTYHKIWDIKEEKTKKTYTHVAIDRWLRLFYGLRALSESESSYDAGYPFEVVNEKKFIIFLLRWA